MTAASTATTDSGLQAHMIARGYDPVDATSISTIQGFKTDKAFPKGSKDPNNRVIGPKIQ